MEDTFNLKQWKSDITLNEDIGDRLSQLSIDDLFQSVRNLANTNYISEEEAAEMAIEKIAQEFGVDGMVREDIDDVDKEIIDIISKRIGLVEKIGEFKKEQDLTTFQVDRWNEIFKSRINWAVEKGLEKDFIEDLYKVIHLGSINVQNKIVNKKKANFKI